MLGEGSNDGRKSALKDVIVLAMTRGKDVRNDFMGACKDVIGLAMLEWTLRNDD
jgi:hypothetical protein